MNKKEAIEEAKKALSATGLTQTIMRRGDDYQLQTTTFCPRGWKVAEMISTGNVHNFEAWRQYAQENGNRMRLRL